MNAKLRLFLQAAPDEPSVGAPESQAGLREFSAALRAAGINASERVYVRDAAGDVSLLGEFGIPLAQAIGPTLGVVLVSWLQGRAGRKVRIKIGDIEAEAQTLDEVEQLLRQAKAFQEKPSTDDEP
jgi:hypothetical protein